MKDKKEVLDMQEVRIINLKATIEIQAQIIKNLEETIKYLKNEGIRNKKN
jgi:hypothetical protein